MDARDIITELRTLKQKGALRGRPIKRRRRRLGLKRTHKLPKCAYNDPVYPEAPLTELHNSFVGAADIGDHYFNLTISKWLTQGQNIHFQDAKLQVIKREFLQYIPKIFDHLNVFGQGTHSLALYHPNDPLYVTVSFTSLATEVKAYGDRNFVENFIQLCDQHFARVTSHIEWMYSRDGHTMTIPLNTQRLPIEEMYSFLEGRTLAEYYDAFMQSPASILLLIGPPGTGKTSFIRGLLHHTQASATVTYDTNILEHDYVFAEFIEGESEIMVLEDSDNFLQKRAEGNTMMHRFLNVGDGLVTAPGKKMIFSTNLPTTREIDPALIRPGRCFDIIEFKPMTTQQAINVAQKANVSFSAEGKDEWTLAEVFNGAQKNTKSFRRVGFV